MEINKLQIEKSAFDINLKFYFFLKMLVKSKLTGRQIESILEINSLFGKMPVSVILAKYVEFVDGLSGVDKKDIFVEIIRLIEEEVDIELFDFSINLYLIKDLLLKEAKMSDYINIGKLSELDPLSLEYDKISIYKPYSTRVNGSLLALLFFKKLELNELNFMSTDSIKFLEKLALKAQGLMEKGVEPNQIFMLMFTESMNQSIISDSGGDFEDRILSVLLKLGIPEDDIEKVHDYADKSTEFDFFFMLDGRSYGIGAKRTLRERYKQFIKTGQMSHIDVMLQVTLGLDLNEEKAKTIRAHGVYLFVANELYDSRQYLIDMEGVYPVREMTINTFKEL